MRRLIIIMFLLAGIAEAKADSIPSFSLSLYPQYFVANTFKAGFDLRVAEDEWLVLSARFTLREKDKPTGYLGFGSENFLRAWGAGMEIAYRKYLNSPKDGARYFFSFNLGYNYYEPVYYRYMWVDYDENGLNYSTFMLSEDKRMIHQPKGEMLMGTLFRAFNGWFFEMNAGGGIKYSFFDKYRGDPENLYRYYWSYGYSGTYFLMNVRIGKEF